MPLLVASANAAPWVVQVVMAQIRVFNYLGRPIGEVFRPEVIDAFGDDLRRRDITIYAQTGPIDGDGCCRNRAAFTQRVRDRNDGKPVARIVLSLDFAYNWSLFTWVVAHELGHAIGLAHNDNPRSFMHPRIDEDLIDGPSGQDWAPADLDALHAAIRGGFPL